MNNKNARRDSGQFSDNGSGQRAIVYQNLTTPHPHGQLPPHYAPELVEMLRAWQARLDELLETAVALGGVVNDSTSTLPDADTRLPDLEYSEDRTVEDD
jgi:hypothetical protein